MILRCNIFNIKICNALIYFFCCIIFVIFSFLGFNPSSVSTPLRNRTLYSPPDTTTIQYSSKHNGLYLYVSRVLRPLWNNRIVQKVVMNNKQYVSIRIFLSLALKLFFIDPDPECPSYLKH